MRILVALAAVFMVSGAGSNANHDAEGYRADAPSPWRG